MGKMVFITWTKEKKIFGQQSIFYEALWSAKLKSNISKIQFGWTRGPVLIWHNMASGTFFL